MRRLALVATAAVGIVTMASGLGSASPGAIVNTTTYAGSGSHVWTRSELMQNPSESLSYFGSSVAMSGNLLAVDAYGEPTASDDDIGAVYLYQRTSASQLWSTAKLVATITPPDPSGGLQFGPIAFNGATLAVGDGGDSSDDSDVTQNAIDVFTEPSGGWHSTSTPTAVLTQSDGNVDNDLFGESLAISGSTIVATAPGHKVGSDAGQGAVYVFSEPASGGWKSATQTAKLTASTGTTNSALGESIAISGNVIVAGEVSDTVTAHSDAGRAYVWVKPGTGDWANAVETRQLQSPASATNQRFGTSVAISGSTVVVGARGSSPSVAGNAYVFTEPAAGWGPNTLAPLANGTRLRAASPASWDGYGSSVAIAGSEVVVGAPNTTVSDVANDGEAYVYGKTSSGWTLLSPLTESRALPQTKFGDPVVLAGSTIVVGATGFRSGGGEVQVFSPLAAPVLSALKQSHKKWTLGKHAARVNPKHGPAWGDRISFKLTEDTAVTMTFTKGHKKLGALAFTVTAGASKVYVDGPLSHHKKLRTGKIKVSVVAANVAGKKTAAKSLSFHAK